MSSCYDIKMRLELPRANNILLDLIIPLSHNSISVAFWITKIRKNTPDSRYHLTNISCQQWHKFPTLWMWFLNEEMFFVWFSCISMFFPSILLAEIPTARNAAKVWGRIVRNYKTICSGTFSSVPSQKLLNGEKLCLSDYSVLCCWMCPLFWFGLLGLAEMGFIFPTVLLGVLVAGKVLVTPHCFSYSWAALFPQHSSHSYQ